jgi:hypothetical protein
MNERIRELAEQANKWSSEEFHRLFLNGIDVAMQELFNEKFAELIVEECADTVKYYHSRNETVTPRQILQHFGVE